MSTPSTLRLKGIPCQSVRVDRGRFALVVAREVSQRKTWNVKKSVQFATVPTILATGLLLLPPASAAEATQPSAGSSISRISSSRMNARQLARATRCEKFKATKPPTVEETWGPRVAFEGKCRKSGRTYEMTVYKSASDTSSALLILKMFAGYLTKPMKFIVGPRWIITSSYTVKSPMINASRGLGGRLRTLQPPKAL